MYIQRTRTFGRAFFFIIWWCTRLYEYICMARELKLLLCLPIVLLHQSPKFWETKSLNMVVPENSNRNVPTTWHLVINHVSISEPESLYKHFSICTVRSKRIYHEKRQIVLIYFCSCNLVLLPQITYPSFLLGTCSCLVEPFYPIYLYV